MAWKVLEIWQDAINEYLKGVRRFLVEKIVVFQAVLRAGTPKRFLFFVFFVGTMLGFGIKYAASPWITIGYLDFTLPSAESVIDLNLVQERFTDTGGSLAKQSENEKVVYPACEMDDF